MTPKGAAAIALTIIIVCPIVLGYALASDDREVTQDKDTDFFSLTDTLFNARSDYFIDYNKVNNNSDMIQRITAQGNTYYTFTSPDYVSVGDNYSSLPAYTTTSYDSIFPSSPDFTTRTVTVPSDPTAPGGVLLGSTSNYYADWSSSIAARVSSTLIATNYYLLTATGSQTYVYIEGVTDTSYPSWDYANAGAIQADTMNAIRTADGWRIIVDGTGYNAEWAIICVSPSGSIEINTYDYNEVSPQVNGDAAEDWHLEMPYIGGAVRTFKDGTYTYYGGVRSVAHSPSYTLIDGLSVGRPEKIEVSYPNSILTYYTKSFTQYADPAYGWRNATSDFPIYRNAWYNQFENAEVTFYVHFDGNGRSEFYENFTDPFPLLQLNRVNGTVTALNGNGSVTLGTYAYARVVFDTREDVITISGLSSWPTMGGIPNLLNTVTLDYDFDGYIEQLKIVDQYTSIPAVVADNYTTNGNPVTIVRPLAIPFYTFILRNSDGDTVPSSDWMATMGSDLRTVTFTPTALSDGIYTLYISSPQVGSYSETVYVGNAANVTTSPISYRVDNALVVAGQYPSTVDYTLNVWGLFPNDTYQRVYINSIGVYGDSITIAGNNYIVTDGTISVTNAETGEIQNVKLLQAAIVMTVEGGRHTTTVNGIPVTVGSSTVPTVVFNGEWSLTATRNTVTEETVIKSEWVPGEFALDDNGFVLVMLLAAVGAFVVLGMTGARSGAKIGILALICGGAAIIGLTII